jgi:pyridoxal phosphate enzyme (YggS family)
VIGQRYEAVKARAAEAALRAGRRPEDVIVLVAAKTFGAGAVREVIDAGGRDIGENYVQEAAAKARELADVPDLRWHLIGRLQKNKARAAGELFQLIHSLDRLELARALDRAAAAARRQVRCLVEVNVGGEETKGGTPPEKVASLLEAIAPLSHLVVEGLMAIPPPGRPAANRRSFAALRELGERLGRLRLPNVQLKELSMGMSGDFEEAIAEGATIVRIGTAIFGPRERHRRA